VNVNSRDNDGYTPLAWQREEVTLRLSNHCSGDIGVPFIDCVSKRCPTIFIPGDFDQILPFEKSFDNLKVIARAMIDSVEVEHGTTENLSILRR
jgi:hypothetical protein